MLSFMIERSHIITIIIIMIIFNSRLQWSSPHEGLVLMNVLECTVWKVGREKVQKSSLSSQGFGWRHILLENIGKMNDA